MAACTVVVCFAAAGPASAGFDTSLQVAGSMNIYNPRDVARTSYVPAYVSMGDEASGRVLTFPSVTGRVSCYYYAEQYYNEPDGNGCGAVFPNGSSAHSKPHNGLGGLVDEGPHRALFLTGVFLGRAPLNTTSTGLGTLSFSAPDGLGRGHDFTELTPGLRQPFFIGDGRIGRPEDGPGRALQRFNVPPGATELYLGTIDSYFGDNYGQWDVKLSVSDAGQIIDSGGSTSSGTCGGKRATIVVDPLQASARGTTKDDVIVGSPASDTIDGMGGNDVICGGDGDDSIMGGEGNDTIDGEGGNDKSLAGGRDRDVISGGLGRDVLYGDEEDDEINGNEGKDTIRGGAGDDTIAGGPDSDTIHGDAGTDDISGNQGEDLLYGDGGDGDVVSGNEDDDYVDGGDGTADRCEGGAGTANAYYDPTGCESLRGFQVGLTNTAVPRANARGKTRKSSRAKRSRAHTVMSVKTR